MFCTDTNGELPAVHIPRDVIDLAMELMPIIDAIEQHGHGEGEVNFPVRPGRKIPFIDWKFRKHRNKSKLN